MITQLPLADVAVVAQTYYGVTGGACAIGEQPIKGLVSPAAMARLALTEALTNLMWAPLTSVPDIKASVNWMYAAKLGGEGAAMYDAAVALRDAMIAVGVAVDGGKDSLSMAAQAGEELVKAPGNLVVSAYCTCPDVTGVVTPDLKGSGTEKGKGKGGTVMHVDLSSERGMLGGSALAHTYGGIGGKVPDVGSMEGVRAAIDATQAMMRDGKIAAGHDISDGGLITCLLEMAFAGNVGIDLDIPAPTPPQGNEANQGATFQAMRALFAEDPGFVVEVAEEDAGAVAAAYEAAGVRCTRVGSVTPPGDGRVTVRVNGEEVLVDSVASLRDAWEDTAFRLERLQCAAACVDSEQAAQATRDAPVWHLPYAPAPTPTDVLTSASKPKVAIIREEGSNGDREMAAAFIAAGFEAWDVAMSDLLEGSVSLDAFRGIAFVGGFSYADVLDSAKGWAGGIRCNAALRDQFQAFYDRPDTFSLGICNGCQLMALLGWVPGGESYQEHLPMHKQPRFVHNSSGRLESRWTQVTVGESPAIMLDGMAGLTCGIWIVHGEGRALFPDAGVKRTLDDAQCFPVRYCDASGEATEAYPFNPNGSPDGIAAICSPNGRHLAMMPHPERCFLNWQMPYAPAEAGLEPTAPSPWLKMWQNARAWCDRTDGEANP